VNRREDAQRGREVVGVNAGSVRAFGGSGGH
jgi:hypothetical protein